MLTSAIGSHGDRAAWPTPPLALSDVSALIAEVTVASDRAEPQWQQRQRQRQRDDADALGVLEAVVKADRRHRHRERESTRDERLH